MITDGFSRRCKRRKMKLATIIWKIEDGIGHLVLNQPPANTMTRQFFDELDTVTRSLIPGSGIKALMVYGSGRHFSSGADHMELRKRITEQLPGNYPKTLPSFLKVNSDSFSIIENLPIPTFAAMRGTCLGSALELALACRFRICGEGTVLGFPESSFGLITGCGGSVRLPRIVGRAKAIELLLTGRNFSAEEAYSWGIVHRIVPRKEVVAEAIRLSGRVLSFEF